MNAGVPTDRLIVEWSTAAAPPVAVSAESVVTIPRLIDTGSGDDEGQGGDTSPTPAVSDPLPLGAPRVLLEIPADIAVLRREHPELAERWRAGRRAGFRACVGGLLSRGPFRPGRPIGPSARFLLARATIMALWTTAADSLATVPARRGCPDAAVFWLIHDANITGTISVS